MHRMRLRTRFLVSGVIVLSLLFGLLSAIYAERRNYATQIAQLDRDHDAAIVARELSLYTQYAAADANAYLLGHREQRAAFDIHTAAFRERLARLQIDAAEGLLDGNTGQRLARLRTLYATYTTATTRLFAAADAERMAPSGPHAAALNAAWTTVDTISDELDAASETTAADFIADAERLQVTLDARNQQVLWLMLIAGTLVAGLVVGTQVLNARAIGTPMDALIGGVQRFASGDYATRVDVHRRDEVGELGQAFNHMADTIQRTTMHLATQFAAAETARADAEAARAEVAQQLDTIQAQQIMIREMSVPVLPVNASTLVMPLVGALDSGRLQEMQTQALAMLERTRARRLLLDITGVPVVDSHVAQGLLNVVQAARLLGSDVTLIGVRPEVAQALVALGLNLPDLRTVRDLHSALAA